jgi:hypothetical protein
MSRTKPIALGYGTIQKQPPTAMVPRWLRWAIISCALVYFVMPIIAGVVASRDSRGPKIYPAELHDLLYYIGYVAGGHDDEPRSDLTPRAWFYRL